MYQSRYWNKCLYKYFYKFYNSCLRTNLDKLRRNLEHIRQNK